VIAPNPAWALPSIPGHEGIEGDWWLAWNLDAPVLLPAVLLGYLYWRGVRRMQRHHSPWHSVAFFSGIAAFVLAIESPIDRLGEHHFTFHMVQHEIFILLGALLLLLGAPLKPLLLGLPRWVRRNLVHPLARGSGLHSIYRWLTWAPASTLLLAGAFVA
jgi:putative membrane protein